MRWLDTFVDFCGGEWYALLAVALTCLGLSLLWTVVRISYAVFTLYRMARVRLRERKKVRKERARRLQYVLPERENEFVRARLEGALRADEKEELAENVEIKLDYTRKMLARVKEAPLSPVERLDVEEMSGLLALFTRKEKWTASDRKAVNEVCARLLKLSAKYEIVV